MTVIDDYLKSTEPTQGDELERIRGIIKQVVPDADETIGYGMPVFRYKNKYLIGMAPFKNHMSIFPGSEPIAQLKDKLKDFKTAKGTVQFTVDNPLPESLIIEIVQLCKAAIK